MALHRGLQEKQQLIFNLVFFAHPSISMMKLFYHQGRNEPFEAAVKRDALKSGEKVASK